MFRTEAESRAFFQSADFPMAVGAAVLAAALVALFLTRTRPGRFAGLVALFTLCVGCFLVLYPAVRLAIVAAGVK